MTLKTIDIIEILKQLSNSQCQEFHLTLGEDSLRLCRNVDGQPRQYVSAPRESSTPEPIAPSTAPPPVSEQVNTKRSTAEPAGEAVTAPMAGIFYRRPSPEEPPFVEDGVEVKVGDPLCVLEVMKLFSTVYAECNGRIVAIHAHDGDSVTKNQLLFSIEPTGGKL